MKIYTPQVSNDYQSILACSSAGREVQSLFNTRSLLAGWEVLDFEFKKFNKSKGKIPDISLLNGGFALRSDLKHAIFPVPCHELEFLPIKVSGQEWLVVNCLRAIGGYDHENSVAYRGLDGKIFMVIHLIVTDHALAQCEMFVVDDSNRANLFLLPSFMERITVLGLRGLVFKAIGVLQVEPAEHKGSGSQ